MIHCIGGFLLPAVIWTPALAQTGGDRVHSDNHFDYLYETREPQGRYGNVKWRLTNKTDAALYATASQVRELEQVIVEDRAEAVEDHERHLQLEVWREQEQVREQRASAQAAQRELEEERQYRAWLREAKAREKRDRRKQWGEALDQFERATETPFQRQQRVQRELAVWNASKKDDEDETAAAESATPAQDEEAPGKPASAPRSERAACPASRERLDS